jgi:RNA polymerase sigma factor (TIGR02999 family)
LTDVTELLHAHGRGESGAFDRVVPLLYQDLRRAARLQLRRLRVGDTLDTTGLVHEAYLRLVDQTRATFHDRGHFLAASAMAMRHILIDHARSRQRDKRGGGRAPDTLDDQTPGIHADADRLLDIDRALERLAAVDPRLVRIVECRFFAGLSEEETAQAVGVSLRTAQRDWLKARALLRQALA